MLFRTLSKSDFKAARSCAAKLYYRELRYPDTNAEDDYLAMLAEGGYMVEALARLRYPEGIALERSGDPLDDAAATAEMLKNENVTLFGATLLYKNRLALVDILEKRGDTFRLVEVKAKSFDSIKNTARLDEGRPSLFRRTKEPFSVIEGWREHIEDVAFQVSVLAAMMPGIAITSVLSLVDKSATTEVDGLPKLFTIDRAESRGGRFGIRGAHFTGDPDLLRDDRCLIELDVSSEAAELSAEVETAAAEFEESLAGDLRKLPAPIGIDCRDCEYRVGDEARRNGFHECWGDLADVAPSVLDLYQAHKLRDLIDELVQSGKASLFDIPRDALVNADGTVGAYNSRRLVQLEHTASGEEWLGARLLPALQSVQYPLHFIDFETSRLALPYHKGMRPYGLVAFQWSCHTLYRKGERPIHREWLNNEDLWPNAKFARSLRNCIGEEGTVLAWATHERATLQQVLEELGVFGESDPELEEWLRNLTESNRILDVNKLTRESFFHPGMGGRTSIKVVLDALWKSDAKLRARFEELTGLAGSAEGNPYGSLPPLEINGIRQQVAEGTGAMRAYQAMMYGVERDDMQAREQWRKLLLQYCELDTLAMVLIWEYWESRLSPCLVT